MKINTCAILFSLVALISVNANTDDLISGNNQFTASSYKEAVKTANGNLLISPLSAEIAVALTQSGAKGETAQEIRSVLHLSDTEEKTKNAYKSFLQSLNKSKDYSLHTANKIYLAKNFSIKDNFKSSATDTYLSEIENIDFAQSGSAVDAINGWVEKQTENKIKNLVDSSVVNEGTLALIVNALYFKAKWYNDHFSSFSVGTSDFYTNGENETVKVDVMVKDSAEYRHYEDQELKAKFLEMNFDGDAQMVFVLPFERDGLANLEKQAEKVFKKHPFQSAIVDLTIPMFKIESSLDFLKILQELGVKKAFVRGQADFSGIAGNKGDFAIDGVMQKTFINVDQNGVEAAAATDLWVYTSGPPDANVIFKADHPFMFYIKVQDVILFAGRVMSPTR